MPGWAGSIAAADSVMARSEQYLLQPSGSSSVFFACVWRVAHKLVYYGIAFVPFAVSCCLTCAPALLSRLAATGVMSRFLTC